jgi:hypothetical protein
LATVGRAGGQCLPSARPVRHRARRDDRPNLRLLRRHRTTRPVTLRQPPSPTSPTPPPIPNAPRTTDHRQPALSSLRPTLQRSSRSARPRPRHPPSPRRKRPREQPPPRLSKLQRQERRRDHMVRPPAVHGPCRTCQLGNVGRKVSARPASLQVTGASLTHRGRVGKSARRERSCRENGPAPGFVSSRTLEDGAAGRASAGQDAARPRPARRPVGGEDEAVQAWPATVGGAGDSAAAQSGEVKAGRPHHCHTAREPLLRLDRATALSPRPPAAIHGSCQPSQQGNAY